MTRSLRELLGRVLAVGIPAVVLLVLLIAALRRRPRRAPAAPSPPPPAPPPRAVPVVAPGEALRRAIAAFRASGDDATLDALRNVLFERAGARPGSTLADALRVLGPANPALTHAMAIAERARFGPHAGRAAAVRDLFDALDAVLAQPVRA